MRQAMTKRWGRLWLGGLLGCVGVALVVVGIILFQNYRSAQAGSTDAPKAEPAKTAKPTRFGADGIEIPAEVVRSLDVKTVPVAAATKPRPMPPMTGVLALDNDRLARVHTRFAGEVVALGEPGGRETNALPDPGSSGDRPLAVGDTVRRGQLLAVVWSKDLGEKKSELIDGLVKLKFDTKLHDELKQLYERGGTAEKPLRDAEATVQGDINAVAKAERTLRMWRLTDTEITAVREEAERLSKNPKARADDPGWARVEVRAPIDGMILEKNVNFGDVVDTTADLYKIADLNRMAVWVHIFEEDLARLQDPKLPKPLPWTINLPAVPGVSYRGHLEQIRPIIDPNQHTALAVGHVENPGGVLKAGQFVTVAIELPPSADEVEVPATALVEDGRSSVVFVQPDKDKLQFARRQVKVLRRLHDVVYLSTKPNDGTSEPVRPGDHVVVGGAVFLNDAMADLPTK
jgi:cobalt-zinc-cadmium efflux system membrane fusion protein